MKLDKVALSYAKSSEEAASIRFAIFTSPVNKSKSSGLLMQLCGEDS